MRVQQEGSSGEWFDASPVPAAIVTDDGVLISASRSLVALLGWDPTVHHLDDLVHPEDRTGIRLRAEGMAGVPPSGSALGTAARSMWTCSQ